MIRLYYIALFILGLALGFASALFFQRLEGKSEAQSLFASAYFSEVGFAARYDTYFDSIKSTETGAVGVLNHDERMSSFSLQFELDCDDQSLHFKPGGEWANEGKNATLTPFRIGSELQFYNLDGELLVFDPQQSAQAKLAAQQIWFSLIDAGEHLAPIEKQVIGITAQTIAEHLDRLKFAAEYLIANRCNGPHILDTY